MFKNPKEKVVLVRPLRFRIEKLIGRTWWLGKNLWEFLDCHREPSDHKFYARKTLREFNIRRISRGWSPQSSIKRRKEYERFIYGVKN